MHLSQENMMRFRHTLVSRSITVVVFAAIVGFAENVGTVQAAPFVVNHCPRVPPELVPENQPFLMNDPRSGLMLYLESDGRHMAALDRNGKIVWHRNIFDDPKMYLVYGPNIQIPGEPRISEEEWRRRTRAYISNLRIDRIGVVSDCTARVIEHILRPKLSGHYIWAGSGTKFNYSLDAKTGDLIMGPIN